jgi:hypothetical protein
MGVRLSIHTYIHTYIHIYIYIYIYIYAQIFPPTKDYAYVTVCRRDVPRRERERGEGARKAAPIHGRQGPGGTRRARLRACVRVCVCVCVCVERDVPCCLGPLLCVGPHKVLVPRGAVLQLRGC